MLGRWLERSDVDVACLQEVVSSRRVALLRSLTPSFEHVVHRPFGPLGIGVRGGLVILSRLPVLSHRSAVYELRGRWQDAGRSDRVIRKGLLLAELDAGGHRLSLVNTHLLANYAADWSEGNGFAQQEHAELQQLADELEGMPAGGPLVVTGDLNVPSDTWLLDAFLQRTGLRDAFDCRGEPTCRPSPSDGSRYDIDHVLVRGPVDVEAELCFREPVVLPDGRTVPLSDHLGISATLRVN